MLTFVAQMDREAVLIVSPDLLGETNELRQSILNIRHVLQQQAEGKDISAPRSSASSSSSSSVSSSSAQKPPLASKKGLPAINESK